MKPLRSLLDRLHNQFKEDGKWGRLYPLYEAADTFLYTPGTVTRGRAHIRDAMDLKRMMSIVVVALLPCMLMAMYNAGYQANLALEATENAKVEGWHGAVMNSLGLTHDPNNILADIAYGALFFLPLYAVTIVAGGTCELIFSIVRKHEINEGFLVTSALFPLTLPPTCPLWQAALGIAFGVVLGKEVFGGTGRNFLNPALTARAFLYFAYPAQMTGDSVWVAVDGYTAATPLGALATAPVEGKATLAAVTDHLSFWDAFIGIMPGSLGETSTLCCLIGAAILIATGIGSWRIMVGVVAGALGLSFLLWGIGSTTNPMFALPPWWHLVLGGFAFGTVFMATDPVSASMTETGKWYYGILIGMMTILIRVINPAYPEGIMLAILFGNVLAPLIDYFVVQANIKRRLARNAA